MGDAGSELSALEASGKYVFHGSPYEVEEFEPRQAHDFIDGEQFPDGEPAIFASPRADYAFFMAIINKVNCPAGFRASSGARGGTLSFRATRETLAQLSPETSGYVYVFDRAKFERRDEFEYFSIGKRVPLRRIEVWYKDFKPAIELMEE
jgi:hypothetical protein